MNNAAATQLWTKKNYQEQKPTVLKIKRILNTEIQVNGGTVFYI